MSTFGADVRRWWRRNSRYRPQSATGWIVAVTVACYVIELLARDVVLPAFIYAPAYSLPATGVPFEPWRMLTSVLLHAPIGLGGGGIIAITHIGFNMYALYLFGRPLEQLIGSGRFLGLYALAGLGGSVAVLYTALVGLMGVATAVYGASGAVFGVLGASAVIQRRLGVDVRYLYVLIAVNFALAFVLSGIAWQAHVGGLAVGAVTGWFFAANRGPRRRGRALAAGVAIGVALVLLAVVPAALPVTVQA
jgi:membrane associated rhomboid family serine protease